MSDDELGTVEDEAIRWHLRLPDAGPETWRAFVEWLEASPEHARCYDELAIGDALLTDGLSLRDWSPAATPAVDAPRGAWRWGGWMAGIGAAAAAAVATLWIATPVPSSEPIVYQTAAGERRTEHLPDGTTVAMNGDTRLTLDRNDPRMASLDRGEALFTVHHDAARPFEVKVGGETLRDVGTVFNVVRMPQGMTVEVAEGAVMFRPERDGMMLTGGQELTVSDTAPPRRSTVAVTDVGSWRQDRLTFSDTPLPIVAASLQRNLGAPVAVDPSLRAMRFTGSLHVTRDGTVARLAKLAGIGWTLEAGRWTLLPRGHASD